MKKEQIEGLFQLLRKKKKKKEMKKKKQKNKKKKKKKKYKKEKKKKQNMIYIDIPYNSLLLHPLVFMKNFNFQNHIIIEPLF